MRENQAKNEVAAAGAELVERGLVARTWGNVSCRIDENRFAVTPSGIAYERLTPGNIVVVDIDTLAHRGGVKPSSEKGIHAAAYRLDPSVNFVVHTHQTYASCESVAGFPPLSPTKEEAAILGGGLALARYGLPGTKKLRGNVEKALSSGRKAVLMESHGAVVTGADRAEAFARAVALENVCRRAACQIPMSGGAPSAASRRVGKGAFEMAGQGEGYGVPIRISAKNLLPPMEALHAALYRANPGFNAIMCLPSEAIDAVMALVPAMPAMLDDFAQMAGGGAKVCPGLAGKAPGEAAAAAARAIKGRNCVLVRGVGAVCCAKDESDCAALLALAEKNALAFLTAAENGSARGIPWLDRKLMRFVYVTKYSKRK